MGIYIRREPPRYWLVESHREGPKVVQKKLKYLGNNEPTPEDLARLKEEFKERVPPRKRLQPKEEKK
ncbi:hypothetical protein ACFLS8_05765 [Chloroflexota bacterium]